jgi:hypothetical protein
MYGEVVIQEGNVRQWYRLFNEGRADMHNEVRSGGQSDITEDLKDWIDGHFREKKKKAMMSFIKFSHMFRCLFSTRLSKLTLI